MMACDPCLILPYRDPVAAKSRLASVISQRQRADLSQHMFEHVLSVARQVLDGRQIVVLTRSHRVRRQLHGRCRVLVEQEQGLNEALVFALTELRQDESRRIAIVHADLPYLTPNDLELLFEVMPEELAVAPDSAQQGTNALAFWSAAPVRPLFGPRSFHRHGRMAAACGLETWTLITPGLAQDVDWPEDLEPLKRRQAWRGGPAVEPLAADTHGELAL